MQLFVLCCEVLVDTNIRRTAITPEGLPTADKPPSGDVPESTRDESELPVDPNDQA